jgi:hypothetical protein
MISKIVSIFCLLASLNAGASGSAEFYDSPSNSPNGCAQMLAAKAYISAYRDAEFRRDLAQETEITLEKKGISPKKAIGAAILIALAYGDVTVANSISAHLAAEYAGYKPWIQIAGGAVGGAILTPLWENKWSQIRKAMFALFGIEANTPDDEGLLDSQWGQMNANLSSTAQIARGNTTAYISLPNFQETYSKFQAGDLRASANNLAFAATFLRKRYREINTLDDELLNRVRSAFTDNVDEVPADFVERVRASIKRYDRRAEEPQAAEFYRQVLERWFEPTEG